MDDFRKADQTGGANHGELVEHELGRRFDGQLPIEREEVPLEFDTSGIREGRDDAIADFFEDHFTDRLQADQLAWTRVAASEERTVVHQSQGASDSRAVENLYFASRKDEELRSRLEQGLGLSVTGSAEFDEKAQGRLLGALVGLASEVHQDSPEIAQKTEALRTVQAQAAEKGHLHVISAGNSGSLFREMQKHAIPIPTKFFVNEFAGPQSIVVGASDDRTDHAFSSNPQVVAKLASPYAGAIFAADGIDRPMTIRGETTLHRGSSYASPQVSSQVVSLLEEQPNLLRDEVVEELKKRARPVAGAEDYLGFGTL